MKYLVPYLVFNGTCREAMESYRDALGGEITLMQTFGESPVDVPPESENRIFNSELQAGGIRFKASDDLPDHAVTTGSNISLYVGFPDQESQQKVFDILSVGGTVLFPIRGEFGMLRDRFGIHWMLVHDVTLG